MAGQMTSQETKMPRVSQGRSTESKIISLCIDRKKSLERGSIKPPLYHGGSMNLNVLLRVKKLYRAGKFNWSPA